MCVPFVSVGFVDYVPHFVHCLLVQFRHSLVFVLTGYVENSHLSSKHRLCVCVCVCGRVWVRVCVCVGGEGELGSHTYNVP